MSVSQSVSQSVSPVPWKNWMAAYLGYTLQMRTLFRGWPIMVNDTHTRRRRRSQFRSVVCCHPYWKQFFSTCNDCHWSLCVPALCTAGTEATQQISIRRRRQRRQQQRVRRNTRRRPVIRIRTTFVQCSCIEPSTVGPPTLCAVLADSDDMSAVTVFTPVHTPCLV